MQLASVPKLLTCSGVILPTLNGGSTHEVCVSGRAARSNNGCLTNSRNCTWYVMMDPKITPSGQTIVKATALGTIAKHRR